MESRKNLKKAKKVQSVAVVETEEEHKKSTSKSTRRQLMLKNYPPEQWSWEMQQMHPHRV
jgi:hypothetical protein